MISPIKNLGNNNYPEKERGGKVTGRKGLGNTKDKQKKKNKTKGQEAGLEGGELVSCFGTKGKRWV